MSEPYLGEIRLASFGFAPNGWALCNGQLLPINQNQALFSLLGTTYGGNGKTTFALPDLRGRLPMHPSSSHTLGQTGGEVHHTLTVAEMPAHAHTARSAASAAAGESPAGAVWAATAAPHYGSTRQVTMSSSATTAAGNGGPHENMPPYLAISFLIALMGVFPSQG